MSEQSNGLFDPSIGLAVSLWDIGGSNPRIPSDTELSAIDTNYKEVKFDDKNRVVSIPSNMEIDLGADGKGYSADLIREYLVSKNVNKAIINLGGNILLIGSKNDSEDWVIGLQDPNKDIGKSYILLSLSDTSVVTSGTYERFFIKDGIKYHHILSPLTLYPAVSDIISSSIISKNSTLCDMLSTTCFIMGSKKALEFMKNYPQASAVFLLQDGSVVFSDNFDKDYQIINGDYSLIN
jgi:thiamine biosynthesis lipoprotein